MDSNDVYHDPHSHCSLLQETSQGDVYNNVHHKRTKQLLRTATPIFSSLPCKRPAPVVWTTMSTSCKTTCATNHLHFHLSVFKRPATVVGQQCPPQQAKQLVHTTTPILISPPYKRPASHGGGVETMSATMVRNPVTTPQPSPYLSPCQGHMNNVHG